ncbi:unnamed protein product [Acanthocheilonema viteae]|uniref:Uncharacterized protein n=1 Tax=Acanthocheilonema viteae TaxID=6277 RepID=A0A498SI13_ACAVI|nr:unnamed protein product [Acanthocheilonema viteae]
MMKCKACVKKKEACIAEIGKLQHREHGHDFPVLVKQWKRIKGWVRGDDLTIGGVEALPTGQQLIPWPYGFGADSLG